MPYKPVGIDEASNFPLRVGTALDARIQGTLNSTLVAGSNMTFDYNATTKKLTISSTGGVEGIITIDDVVDLRETLDGIVAGDVPNATTTSPGIIRLPTAVERDAGTATNLAMSPADVQDKINVHVNAPDPHANYTEAIELLQADVANKVSSPVQIEEISDVATGPLPDSLVQRTATGAIVVADAGFDGEAVNLKQARDLVEFTPGAVVRDLEATGLPLTLGTAAPTATTGWTTLPGILVPDAETGQKWECELFIKYQAETASGLKIRHKAGVAAVTNLFDAHNPSFETTDVSFWTVSSNATLVGGVTAGGAFHGSAYGVLTATGTGNLIITSGYMPIGAATVFASRFRHKVGAGTARNARIDMQWSADGITGGGWDLGPSGETVFAGATWQASSNGGVDGSSSNVLGVAYARVRIVYVGTAVGDKVFLDAVQLETSAPIPAYGSTGGSGASVLAVTGSYSGLTLDATTGGNYSRRESVRTPAVTLPTAGFDFGGLGTSADADLLGSLRFAVTGQGLQNQRIEFEVAPRLAATVAPKIVAASAVFARVL